MTVKEIHLKTYRSVVFVTHSGIGLNVRGLIKETFFDHLKQTKFFTHFLKYSLFKLFTEKKKIVSGKERNIIIHHHWSKGYHHWVAEVLLKINLVDTSEHILLLPEGYPKFALESLQAFKFKNIVLYPLHTGIIGKNISFISNPLSGNFIGHQLQSLKKTLINHTNVNKNDDFHGIYISRKNAGLRKIENESEVIDFLKNFGFNILYSETLSFWDQVQIFQNCKLLVSIHGAGLTNMLFMNKNSSVVEFYRELSGRDPNLCYQNLALALGINHNYLFCDHGEHLGDPTDIDRINIRVDISRLADVLKNKDNE